MPYDIKFSPPDISEEDITAVTEVLRSGWITTGPKTKLFEQKIASYCGTDKAAALNSATACLEMTLRLLGIGEGDEVITSAYTYSASCSVILHVGATPVLVDTAKNSFEMDYEKLEKAITPRTKAIIPVDLGGVMCDYDKISQIVNAKKSIFKPSNKTQEKFGRIVILADGAHSFGAEQNGKKSGSVADFTCFSFHAVKNLTTGEGGAVTWKPNSALDNDEIYRQYMLLSLHGQNKDALAKTKAGAWEYDIIYPAYKCNMTDIMAALGLSQLGRYDKLLARRREITEIYNSGLKDLNIQTLPHITENAKSSCHLYITRLLGKDEKFRNKFIENMASVGISTNVHYKSLPMFTAYKNIGFDVKDFPNAYDVYANEVTLPLHTLLKNEEIYYILENYKKFAK
ncbi:MAG: DegT/DnrJ/EryC1/StrS aminotransferase family protein [Clostridia bacterium]|nr:DegT/DnrJ/EryC1/StrS aminotransferase family protein [Clostridia bacterium]